jgi:hypothetical protein
MELQMVQGSQSTHRKNWSALADDFRTLLGADCFDFGSLTSELPTIHPQDHLIR